MYRTVALVLGIFLVARAQGGSLTRFKHLSTRQILPTHKIVGGNDTDIIDVPYQVQVGLKGTQICGGSILSENFVLTGADCLFWYTPRDLSIRYGTSELNKGGILILVMKTFTHPLWNSFDTTYDVGVAQLAKPIKFSETAKPIALASKEPVAGEKALISGWGYPEDGGDKTIKLQSTVVTVVDRDNCSVVNDPFARELLICAGEAGIGGCYGDYGGPFVTNSIQSGIIINTLRVCGDTSAPGVYSNVVSLRSFIDESTGGEVLWV